MKLKQTFLTMELNLNSSPPQITVSEDVDKHTESIEFSNSCRKFYISRLKATESFKKQLHEENNNIKETPKRRPKTTIDTAMDKLKNEMASLMDQDLSLMKQLLTLNETIEDLKANRKVSHSRDSLSPNVNTSDWSVSETDMYSPDEEQPVSKLIQSCVRSQLSEQKNIEIRLNKPSVEEPKTPDNKSKPVPKSRIPTPQKPLTRTPSSSSMRNSDTKTSIPVYVKLRRVRHKEQDSMDSGYGDCGRIHKDIEILKRQSRGREPVSRVLKDV